MLFAEADPVIDAVPAAERAAICMAAFRRILFDSAPIESGTPLGVRDCRSEIQESSVSTSAALPGEVTNEVASDAGVLFLLL